MKRIFLLLWFAVLLISFYRTQHLLWQKSDNWFNSDSFREIFISRHVAIYNDYPLLPPPCAACPIYISNSPLYNSYLGVLYRLFPSEVLLTSYVSLIKVFTCLVIFLICSQFLTLPAALLGTALYATSYPFPPLRLSQINLIPLFSSVMILATFQAFRSKSYFWLTVSFIFIYLSIHFHYSILSVIPLIFITNAYLFIHLTLNRSKKKFPWLLTLSVNVAGILAWLNQQQYNAYGLFARNHIHQINSAPKHTNIFIIIQNSFMNLRHTFNYLIGDGHQDKLIGLTFIFFLLFSIFSIVRFFKNKAAVFFYLTLVNLFLLQYIFTGFYESASMNYYDSGLYVPLIISFSTIISLFSDKIFKSSAKYLIFLATIPLIFIRTVANVNYSNSIPDSAISVQNILQTIESDSHKNTGNYLVSYNTGPYFSIYLPYYYFEETKYHHLSFPLKEFAEGDINTYTMTVLLKNRPIYHVCSHSLIFNEDNFLSTCDIDKIIPKYLQSNYHISILKSETNPDNKNFVIYKIVPSYVRNSWST